MPDAPTESPARFPVISQQTPNQNRAISNESPRELPSIIRAEALVPGGNERRAAE